MPARRPGKGDRRIDAAIDHFAVMGYDARHVTAVVRDLLKVYGGPSPEVWRVLEEVSYQVVQNKLFEIEEEQKMKQDAQLLLECHQIQDGQQVEDEPPQHQEPTADKEVKFTEPPSREAVLPFTAARRTGPRLHRCLSDSEVEEEEQPTGQKHEVHVLSPVERAQYIVDQAAKMAPENTEDAVAEEGEPMAEEIEDVGNIQAGRRAGPPRLKKANVRLAGPEWAK